MFWTIEFFPKCDYHVFLSHCAEDRTKLVYPLYEALRERGVHAWIDRHDYPYGRGSRAALRDAILICRHVIFLITDAMLTSARGWCVQELAWSELLQDNLLQPGGPALANVILPLYFVEPNDPRLSRSVWHAVRDKGQFCPSGTEQLGWAVEQVEHFLRREESLSRQFRRYATHDEGFRTMLKTRSGLRDRVIRFDPPLSRGM